MNASSLLDRLRAWAALLPLLLLLAATYWLNQQVRPLPRDDDKRHDPDFIVSNFSATSLNEEGAPHVVLTAKSLTHYPDDDSTHLNDPNMNILSPGQPAIGATARDGEISSKGEDVTLRNDVRLVRASDAKRSEMVFTTDTLHIVPDRDYADTASAVTMTDAYNVIHAKGMTFDGRAHVIKLLSEVTSQHEPVRR